MTKTLEIQKATVVGGCHIALCGPITDQLDPAALSEGASGVVILDLDQVSRVTSYGVREWVRALGQIRASYLGFVGVRPAVVAQFNMVRDFGAKGEVVSAYLPYACDDCGQEHDHLVEFRAHFDALMRGVMPEVNCPSCGLLMEFDDLAESYFQFLRERGCPHPPPLAERLIAKDFQQDTSTSDAFHATKVVTAEYTALWLRGALTPRVRLRRLLDGLEGVVVLDLHDVTELAAPRVVESLRDALRSSEYELYLSRVPARYLSVLVSDSTNSPAGRVLGVRTGLSCPGCDAAAAVLEGAVWAAAVQRGGLVPCGCCGDTAVIEEGDDVASYPFAILTTHIPSALRPFLAGGCLPPAPEHTGASFIGQITGLHSQEGESTADESARYRILKSIGRGGMAEVFLAMQRGPEGFQKRVVLKRIREELADGDGFVDMFLDEARLAARINHPNVVQIFELIQERDSFFIAMEYVQGLDLRSVLATSKKIGVPLPVGLCCRIIADLCAGLYAAHTVEDDEGRAAGVIHRDVSPHNILVADSGNVKIVDFGIARPASSHAETRSEKLKGKASYMSPEQIDESWGPVDTRTDIFAAGLVLYECLTGISPFRRESEVLSLYAVLHDVMPDVRAHRSDVPHTLLEVITRSTERDPMRRFQTANEMSLALEEVILSEGLSATRAHLAHWLSRMQLAARAAGLSSARPFTAIASDSTPSDPQDETPTLAHPHQVGDPAADLFEDEDTAPAGVSSSPREPTGVSHEP